MKNFVSKLDEQARDKYFSNLAVLNGNEIIMEVDKEKFNEKVQQRLSS